MSWLRLDDGFSDHPKVLAVGPAGGMLQIRALCYASRHLTDGFIPALALPAMTAGMNLGADAMAIVMVGAGLWDPADGGFQIHDYLTYNPSRAQIDDLRRKRAMAGSNGGKNSAATRSSRAIEANAQALASYNVEPHPIKDGMVVTPKIQSDQRASRSTRRVKSKKPGSFGRL